MSRIFFIIVVSGLLDMMVWTPLFGQFRTEIPFVEKNGKLMVDAEINGHKGRFLVDTGAPCTITHSFFQKLGISVLDSVPSQDSNGNVFQTKLVGLESVKLGDTTFNRLQAICMEKGNIIESFKIDGIIGYNLLRMGIVKFNERKHLLTFTNTDKDLRIDPLHGVPMIKDPYLTRFVVSLGKYCSDIVMFDSGASGFYSMAEKNYFRLKNRGKGIKTLASGKGILSLGAAGIEQASTKYRLKIPSFKLGNTTFDNVTSVTTNAADSRMGSEMLKYGEVIIDYPRNIFYYIPFEPCKRLDLYKKEWDVDITVVDGYLTAGMVWDYTKSSLKGGERIVEIEGRKYDKVDLYQATMSGLISLPKDQAQIKYIDLLTGGITTTTISKH